MNQDAYFRLYVSPQSANRASMQVTINWLSFQNTSLTCNQSIGSLSDGKVSRNFLRTGYIAIWPNSSYNTVCVWSFDKRGVDVLLLRLWALEGPGT